MAEITALTPAEEKQYLAWVKAEGIPNADSPDSHYDMRGYWKDIASKGLDKTEINDVDHRRHFPDTYKQHGHPTFSQESKYSAGAADGGIWIGPNGVVDPLTTLFAQPPMAISHPTLSPFAESMLLQKLGQK